MMRRTHPTPINFVFLFPKLTDGQLSLHSVRIVCTLAYDKVDRDVLWLLLSRRGVPSNLINVIKGLHVGAQARVRGRSVL